MEKFNFGASFQESFEETTSNIDDYLRGLDIDLAELEKIGAFLLSLGYSNIFAGAELDIYESLEINNTGKTPDHVTFIGQKQVFIGYCILLIVAIKRYNERKQKNEQANENINLSPWQRIAEAYLLSVYANAIRLQAFSEIDAENNGVEIIV